MFLILLFNAAYAKSCNHADLGFSDPQSRVSCKTLVLISKVYKIDPCSKTVKEIHHMLNAESAHDELSEKFCAQTCCEIRNPTMKRSRMLQTQGCTSGFCDEGLGDEGSGSGDEGSGSGDEGSGSGDEGSGSGDEGSGSPLSPPLSPPPPAPPPAPPFGQYNIAVLSDKSNAKNAIGRSAMNSNIESGLLSTLDARIQTHRYELPSDSTHFEQAKRICEDDRFQAMVIVTPLNAVLHQDDPRGASPSPNAVSALISPRSMARSSRTRNVAPPIAICAPSAPLCRSASGLHRVPRARARAPPRRAGNAS